MRFAQLRPTSTELREMLRLAAPIVARYLGDFGADVIKVESSTHPDTLRVGTPYAEGASLDRSGYFAAYSAGKRSFALNLKSPQGIAAIRALIATADVVVHNFRAGVMEKLGLGYEQLAATHPRLVYASSGGWGDHGPSADRARGGHDLLQPLRFDGWMNDDFHGRGSPGTQADPIARALTR